MYAWYCNVYLLRSKSMQMACTPAPAPGWINPNLHISELGTAITPIPPNPVINGDGLRSTPWLDET